MHSDVATEGVCPVPAALQDQRRREHAGGQDGAPRTPRTRCPSLRSLSTFTPADNNSGTPHSATARTPMNRSTAS